MYQLLNVWTTECHLQRVYELVFCIRRLAEDISLIWWKSH